MTSHGLEYSFGQCRSLVSPPSVTPTPSPFTGVVRDTRGGLAAAQALLSKSKNIGALSTPFQPWMQSTALCALLWRKFTPSQPDPVQQLNVGLHLWRLKKCFTFLLEKKTTPKPTNQAKYQTPKKLLFYRAKNSTLTIDIHNTKMMQTTLGELDINKLPTMNRIQSGHLWELGEKMTSSEPFWNVICCNSKRTTGSWREIWITEYRVLCQMRMYSLLRIKAKVKLVETF